MHGPIKIINNNALLHNADIVEMDIIRSTDGVFYGFHDGEEKELLGTEKDIRIMTSAEIESFRCINEIGHRINQHIERVDFILNKLRNRCFINIDRSWFYWEEAIAFLDSFEMNEQIILKSPPDKELLKKLEQSGSSLMYMPIIKTLEEWNLVKSFNINIVATELIFTDLDTPFLSSGYIECLHEEGILTWVNVITLDDEIILSGLLDDNRAIIEGTDKVYGKLFTYGFDIFQTDWPTLLVEFRNKISKYKAV